MKKTFAWIVIAFVAIALLPLIGLMVMLGLEGYPTITAARNFLDRDGQIRIEMPPGYKITKLIFEGDDVDSIHFDGSVGVIRAGYTVGNLSLHYTNGNTGGELAIHEIKKTNNWNRLTFRATSAESSNFDFEIDENGVARDPSRYLIEEKKPNKADMATPRKPSDQF